MFNTVLSSLIGGVGLLFIALKILEASMRDLTSGYVRVIIKKNTSNDVQAGFWGSLMGFVAGDPAVVGFIAATLYSCKSINLPRAMIMSIWSNVGSCCLFFIVFIDIDLLVLYLIGITGFAFYLEKPFQWRHFIGAIFAVCLMLYALTLMESQSENLVNIPWIKERLHQFQSSYFKPFLICALLTMILQGADIVILVVVANLVLASVITTNQALFMVFGMHLGLSAINFIISLGIKGVMKQIIAIQVLVDSCIAIVFSLLLAVELFTGTPMLKALTLHVAHSIWSQLIFVIFFANITISLLFSIFMKPIGRVMDRLFPLVLEVDPAIPKYIGNTTLSDPDSALDMIDRELLDLLQRLPLNVEYKIGKHDDNEADLLLKLKHEQHNAVMREIEQLMKEIGPLQMNAETSDKLLAISDRIQIVISLEEGIYHLTLTGLPKSLSEGLHTLALEIFEAQQTLLETIINAIETRSEEDIDMLVKATAGIKPAIDSIRKSYFKQEGNVSIQDKTIVLTMTSLFERNVWILRRLAYQFIPKKLLGSQEYAAGVPLELH